MCALAHFIQGQSRQTLASFLCESIRELPGGDKDIIFGASYDDSLDDVCYVTIIAADFAEKFTLETFYNLGNHNNIVRMISV